MRRVTSPALVLLFTICAFLLASAHQASAADGLLVIKHSPTLSIYVAVVVRIDGQDAGMFSRGHIYERYLTPGRHVIEVFRNGRTWDAFRMTLNVHGGHTYSYLAKYATNQMVLTPVGRIR
ncbi:MAG: hypothetical protein ACXWHF_00790 [Chthoniobacterales bacterium]